MNIFMPKILTFRWTVDNLCKRSISTGFWNMRGKRYFKQENPGLDERLSIIDTSLDEIDMEDVETDFMKAGKMYDSHTNEMESRKEVHKLEIVKRKYFKPKHQANFLTWAEKEQIRHLHRSDPVEWTTEKLEHSFPASEMIIKKIIKSQWRPENQGKVISHDKSVASNWRALEHNKVDIDVKYKNHLLKFVRRERATLAHSNTEENVTLQLVDSLGDTSTGVFLNIIRSYNDGGVTDPKHIAVANMGITNSIQKSTAKSSPKGDTYLLGDDGTQKTNKKSELSTLQVYRENINTYNDDNGTSFKINMLPETIKPNERPEKKLNHSEVAKFKTQNSVNYFKSEKKSSFYSYDEHISIPKNKWKEGGTYKVGECYYDDDGEFLYRVPGMK